MKHKIIKPDKEFELEKQVKKPDSKLPHVDEVMNYNHIYWIACAYNHPFMPMIDLAFAFDELKQIVKECLATKNKDKNHL